MLKKEAEERRERIRKLSEEFNARLKKAEGLVASRGAQPEETASLGIAIVCVYKNGTIVLHEETKEYQLNDDGYQELFLDLARDKASLGLEFVEIRALARLVKITENASFNVEVICDNPKLKEVYLSLLDSRQI